MAQVSKHLNEEDREKGALPSLRNKINLGASLIALVTVPETCRAFLSPFTTGKATQCHKALENLNFGAAQKSLCHKKCNGTFCNPAMFPPQKDYPFKDAVNNYSITLIMKLGSR